jgi:hypothetical protein
MPTVRILDRDFTFELEPMETPEEAAWQTNLAEGWGDPADQELAEAARIASLDMSSYARERRNLGPGRANRGMFS